MVLSILAATIMYNVGSSIRTVDSHTTLELVASIVENTRERFDGDYEELTVAGSPRLSLGPVVDGELFDARLSQTLFVGSFASILADVGMDLSYNGIDGFEAFAVYYDAGLPLSKCMDVVTSLSHAPFAQRIHVGRQLYKSHDGTLAPVSQLRFACRRPASNPIFISTY